MISRRMFFSRAAGAALMLSGFSARSARAASVAKWPPPGSPAFWRMVREQFLLTHERMYFNSGGLGPTPLPVLNAMDAERRRLEHICETGHAVREEAAEKVAAFLGAAAEEICFTRNATEGMNLIARGLALQPGDEVVMTTHEHPGGALPWLAVAKEKGLRIRLFDPENDPRAVLNRVEAVLSPRTRVIMVSHVTCTLGTVFPVAELCALARERGVISVLDGAQAVGQIPVHLHAIGCDFYTTSGHKWLLGPKESGILYISRKMQSVFHPTFVGAYSDRTYDLDRKFVIFREQAVASEYGTRDAAKVRGLEAAVAFFQAIGEQQIFQRIQRLAAQLKQALAASEGVELLTSQQPESSAGIVTFRIRDIDYREVTRRLIKQYHMRVRPVGEHHLNAVRVSLHIFNQEKEVEALVQAIRTIREGSSS